MMINIQKLIEEANENGYHGDKASAKVCQDIVLKALSIGPLSRNVTIKGGVVMRSKTNNVRRATQDLDIDFIKYSLADESIDAFISKLNCLDGIKISVRRHIVGGANRTLISVLSPLRLCRTGTRRRLPAE